MRRAPYTPRPQHSRRSRQYAHRGNAVTIRHPLVMLGLMTLATLLLAAAHPASAAPASVAGAVASDLGIPLGR